MKDKFFYIKQYFLYRINAKNEFSLHSPFVFDFYTKVIKRKKLQKGLKKEQLILKIFEFFPDYTVITPQNYPSCEEIAENTLKPYTITVLEDIHTRKNHNVWQQILRSTDCCVKLDIFYYGILINNPKILASYRKPIILR